MNRYINHINNTELNISLYCNKLTSNNNFIFYFYRLITSTADWWMYLIYAFLLLLISNYETAIVDAVGGKIEIIVDGGIRRGTHVLKAISLGATACSFGKGFLFALSAGGQSGVEMILKRMKEELRRDMILLGKKKN